MPTIESLQLAVGKSLRAQENVPTLGIDIHGRVVGDRQCMLVEGQEHTNTTYQRGHTAPPGHFLSQREDPVLTGIMPALHPEGLLFSADGRESLVVPEVADVAKNRTPVSVWGWHGEAVDQGPAAADWASDIVGRPVKVVTVSGQRPRYVEGNPALGQVGFADSYALTGTSQEAYKLLNQQLVAQGKDAVPNNRMRATFVLAGLAVPNAEALPEGFFPDDYVKEIAITSNGLTLVLQRRKPGGRCAVIDTNQENGERKGRPVLAALTKLGRHGYYADQEQYGTDAQVFFSQNYLVKPPADMPPDGIFTIESGAEVAVTYTNETNWVPKNRA